MSALTSRWGQLIIGIVCMVMIANLQYGWTLFVLPIGHATGWSRAAIQVAFTVFVLCETWLLPLEGYVIDRIGPRLTVCAGGVLIGAAWVLDSVAGSLMLLYTASAIGGIGSGFIYGATVGNAIKWFPDKRGLAAGLTAAGFGAGSAVTLVPVSNMIARSGYQHTFLFFGLLQGIVVVVAAQLLQAPPGTGTARGAALPSSGMNALRPSRLHDITRDYAPGEVAREPVVLADVPAFRPGGRRRFDGHRTALGDRHRFRRGQDAGDAAVPDDAGADIRIGDRPCPERD